MTGIDVNGLRIGDTVRLRKPHACGGSDWAVVRLGADIGLRCAQCRRRVLIERPVLGRRIVAIVAHGDGPTAAELIDLAERGP